MICQFKRLIYPKTITVDDTSYMIVLYHPCEKVVDAAGNLVSEIKAVGYCLPTADNLRYDIRGRWSRNAKHGVQFEVESFNEVIVPSKEGIIAYLCSGQIKGVGPKTAERIYAMFGQNTLTVLDREPEQLLAVSGISKTKLQKICDSYLASRLCEMVGIGFKTADRIAVSMGFDPLSPERVDEGLVFTLTDAELKGHLCMEKHSFLKQCLKLLDTDGLTEEMLAIRASRLLENGRLASYGGQVYRAATARVEQNLAWGICRMLSCAGAESSVGLDTEISAEEKRQGIQLAAEQRQAVMTALTSQLSVITGGPGAVLSEILACGVVPVVRLDRIFRQSYGSRIAANAKLIRHGNLSLEYGEDFQFFDSSDMIASAQQIETLYMQETARYGVDNVALLTPYRQKTETGVNALNDRLREKINPPDRKKPEVIYRKRIYRLGDKVMQTKNCEDISNGDIGYITSITSDSTNSAVTVDFGDARIAEYDGSDLEMLDLAYASTIHKSQGSEYKSVIINLQCAHSVMLVRPLVYTAITRAKERVLLVGERRALCIAIKRTDTEQRGTMLSARIRELTSNLKGDHYNGNMAQ